MKINELENKIIAKLKGDKLAIFLDKKQDHRRNLDLISNRLSLYNAAFFFLFGWVSFLVCQALGHGTIDATQFAQVVLDDVGSSIYFKISIVFAIFSCWGMIVDTFRLGSFARKYGKYLRQLNEKLENKNE